MAKKTLARIWAWLEGYFLSNKGDVEKECEKIRILVGDFANGCPVICLCSKGCALGKA